MNDALKEVSNGSLHAYSLSPEIRRHLSHAPRILSHIFYINRILCTTMCVIPEVVAVCLLRPLVRRVERQSDPLYLFSIFSFFFSTSAATYATVTFTRVTRRGVARGRQLYHGRPGGIRTNAFRPVSSPRATCNGPIYVEKGAPRNGTLPVHALFGDIFAIIRCR